MVDRHGKLRDVKAFWLRETASRGFSRRSAKSVIGMRVHEMLRYLFSHGVDAVVLENPDILGKLKLPWVRSGDREHKNYNHGLSMFRSSVVEMIAMKALALQLKVAYVSPRG